MKPEQVDIPDILLDRVAVNGEDVIYAGPKGPVHEVRLRVAELAREPGWLGATPVRIKIKLILPIEEASHPA